MKKALAFLTASVMALGSLPFLSVGAESFAPGDVDMDGVLTGHDTALVSRHLARGDNSLSRKQLELADYNGDGVVDQTDVEAIHENEVWELGDVDMSGELRMDDAQAIFQEFSYASAGRNPIPDALTDVQKNLADMSGKYTVATEVTLDESFDCLVVYSLRAASRFDEVFPVVNGQKCYFFDNPYENDLEIIVK